jgi:phage terminase large subunit
MDLSFLNPMQRKMAENVIKQCAVSRVWFVKNVLKVEHIEDWQMEELTALDTGETKLSIKSGHGVGKTTFCSWLALHFLLFRDDVKVIVTSPSEKQLTDGLIPEIQKWVNRLPGWMASQIDITSQRMTRSPNNANNFVSFRTARKENPEALAGVHASHVLIIVDEASGVDEAIYETGQGALSTKGAIAVLIGNPTRPSGFFFKTHTELNDLWRTRTVSCFDSSRVDGEYIKSQERTYGLDSREYKVRVLGEFTDSGADAIIPRKFLESALDRDVSPVEGSRVWGVDPGRGGDPTGFCDRGPNMIHALEELRYDNLMQVVGWVKHRWDSTPARHRPTEIFVDSIGLGAGVADRLLELGLPVVSVNVSESAAMVDRFVRLRAELWYAVREWFEGLDVLLPSSLEKARQLIDELAAPEQRYASNGKVDVESKKDMKARGMKSPNLADALGLTFANGGATMAGRKQDFAWGKVDTRKYRASGVF